MKNKDLGRKFPEKYDKYQEAILKIIRSLNDRQILFVIDIYGKIDKSYLMDCEEYKSERGYLVSEWHIIRIESQVKSGISIMQNVHGQVVRGVKMGKEVKEGEVLIFMDIPKATAKRLKTPILAGVLEEIKKGRAFDIRWKYKKIHFNYPKICVFTNSELDGITIPTKHLEIKGRVIDEEGERHLMEDRIAILRVPKTWKN